MVAAIPVVLAGTALLFLAFVAVLYGNRIFPRVSAAGIRVGGMTEEQAAVALRDGWRVLTLRDGNTEWTVDPAAFGVTLDAEATAAGAFAQGRGQGAALTGLASAVDVAPILNVDTSLGREALAGFAPQVERAPVDAGVRLVNGHAEAAPPVNGRALDIERTLARLQDGAELADGALDLVMVPVPPAISDSSVMVAAAEVLLSHDLNIRAYDPVTGDSVVWTVPPAQWASWLNAVPDSSQPTGLMFTVDEAAAAAYVSGQAASVLDPSRYVVPEEVAQSIRESIEAGAPAGYARVYHHDRVYTVQPGETLITIAWDFGVPYPWIERANPGLGWLAPGQQITIPSPDNFLEYPVIPDKRIVVSISRQHAWVYENGGLKWDWVVSTGISDSPTWPGIYQIISHEPNAYAANWNLYMPNFLGVYRPIPGADFTNGFHGFPTRGGSQLLWTNNLGTPVTYGCILLSNQNAQLLYNWAEEGVVVEIQP